MSTEENTSTWRDMAAGLTVAWDCVTNEAWANVNSTQVWTGTATSLQDAINQYRAI